MSFCLQQRVLLKMGHKMRQVGQLEILWTLHQTMIHLLYLLLMSHFFCRCFCLYFTSKSTSTSSVSSSAYSYIFLCLYWRAFLKMRHKIRQEGQLEIMDPVLEYDSSSLSSTLFPLFLSAYSYIFLCLYLFLPLPLPVYTYLFLPIYTPLFLPIYTPQLLPLPFRFILLLLSISFTISAIN